MFIDLKSSKTVKKVFLKSLQNSQGNTCGIISFLLKLKASDLHLKPQVRFSCEFCEILRTPLWQSTYCGLLLRWVTSPNGLYFEKETSQEQYLWMKFLRIVTRLLQMKVFTRENIPGHLELQKNFVFISCSLKSPSKEYIFFILSR